eukprot:gene3775-4699_t
MLKKLPKIKIPKLKKEKSELLLGDADEIAKLIDKFKLNTDSLEAKYKQGLHSYTVDIEQRYGKEIKELTDENNQLAHKIKDLLDSLKDGASIGNESTGPMKENVFNSINNRFKDVLQAFYKGQSDYKNRLEEKLSQKYRIVNPTISHQEIQVALKQPDPGSVFFKTSVGISLTEPAKDALSYIKSRHDEIKTLEASMRELHETFSEMSILVHTQGEILRDAEQNVGNVVLNTREAVQLLHETNKLQKKSRSSISIYGSLVFGWLYEFGFKRLLCISDHTTTKYNNVIDELKARGFIYQMTSPDETMKQITEKNVSLYAGFDPTADSLHIGNLITLMVLLHFKRYGHSPIALVGGATGLIGDPSGKSTERPQLSLEFIQQNTESIKKNIVTILGDDVKVVNNIDWTNNLSIISFFRDVGRYFRVGSMIKKEFVKNRLSTEDEEGEGIGLPEFCYSLFQANDYVHLNQTENCVIQVGGSDQWGNIVDGCDLIKKKSGKNVNGITIPLLTNSQGKKLGKSEGNSIWLSQERTSPFKFYQYFIQIADEDVEKLLKLFTLLPLEEIEQCLSQHKESPSLRIAQKKIAQEITKLVHGQKGLDEALITTDLLFGDLLLDENKQKGLDLGYLLSRANAVEVEKSKYLGNSVVNIFTTCSGMTKNQAKTFVQNGSLYLNSKVVESNAQRIEESDLIAGNYLFLRSEEFNEDHINSVANMTLVNTLTIEKLALIKKESIGCNLSSILDYVQRKLKEDPSFQVSTFYEQIHLLGHYFHPLAKLRKGFSIRETIKYCPEFSNQIDLQYIAVDKSLVGYSILKDSTYLDHHNIKDPNQFIFSIFPSIKDSIVNHFIKNNLDINQYSILFVHPFQKSQIVPKLYSDLLNQNKIIILPDSISVPSQALVSMRTLSVYNTTNNNLYPHIKLSLNVVLTSSIRTISSQSAHNSTRISKIILDIAQREKEQFQEKVEFLPEIFSTWFNGSNDLNQDKINLKSLTNIWRFNPNNYCSINQHTIICCSLFSVSPITNQTIIMELIGKMKLHLQLDICTISKKWFNQYIEMLLTAGIIFFSRYGIAFELHLQNTLLVVNCLTGEPIKLLIKDWAGIRIFPPRLKRQGYDFDYLPGSVTIKNDISDCYPKIFHSLFICHISEVINTISENVIQIKESELWDIVYEICSNTFQSLKKQTVFDPELVEQVCCDEKVFLESPLTRGKSLTKMRLYSNNQSEIFFNVKNPLFKK